jgi:hypothetical protein
MAKELDPREMFERACRAIAPGEAWQAAIADLMGVRRDTVRQLKSGHLHLRSDHFATLLSLITHKQAELKKIEVELRQWLASQSPTDGERPR